MKNFCRVMVVLLFLAFFLISPLRAQAASQPQSTPLPEGTAQPAPVKKNVLILFGYESDFAPDTQMQAEFDKAGDLTVNQFYEYTDFNRFAGDDYQKQLASLYTAKYRDYPPDLVILAGRAALTFWQAHRAEIAPDAPVVAFDLTPADLSTIQSMPNSTGLGSSTDFNKSVDWMLQTKPLVNEIIFAHGAGPYDQQFFGYATSLQAHLAGKARFTDWSGYSLAEMKQRAAGLSSGSVIVYAPIFQDAAGINYDPGVPLRELAKVSAVPVLTSFEQFIGSGAIGGYSYSISEQAAEVVQVGLRILRGEAASSIPLNFDSGNRFMFDYPVLQRYDIALSSLPPDSIVKNRQYTFWETYQPQIIVAGLIMLFLILVSGVLAVLNRRLTLARRDLNQLNASLETQVQERTAALSSANAAMAGEIVERKQVEQALRESEALFRSYFDLPLVGIAITSPEKGWLKVNDSLRSMLGYTDEELAGVTWVKLTHPDDRAPDEALFEKVLAGEIDSYTLEKRFIHKNGEIIWTNLSVGCVRKPDGKLDYTVALLQNISRRKAAEAALAKSEKHYRFLAENMNDVVWILDPATMYFSYVSPSVKRVHGYNPEEFMAIPLGASLVPEVREPFLQRTRQRVADFRANPQTEMSYRNEAQLLHKDGSVIYVEVTNRYYLNEATGKVEILGVGRDITERKRAELALQESEQNFRNLSENTTDAILILNPEGRHVYANRRATELLGYLPDEILQTSMQDNADPAALSFLQRRLEDRLAGRPAPATYEISVRRKDGASIPVEVSGSRTVWQDQICDLVMMRDITERKQAQAALLAANAELELRVAERTAELQSANLALEKAVRMKDEFFAAMSHELRTPLIGVLGLAQVLLMQVYGPMNEKQTNAVLNIETSGKRLLELINNILDYTHLEAGMIQPSQVPFLLEDVCQNCLKTYNLQAEAKHLRVSLSIEPRMILLRADPTQLGQAINHLVNNAIKFTAEGGSFGIEVFGNSVEHLARITVWDSGIGIKSEDFPRLFKPFIQLDARLSRNFNGTGLGLALVKRLVELQGGRVDVESVAGQGSRFSISLPWQLDES